MKKLLNEISIALDDWSHTCAPDFCDIIDVSESLKRISENGGTVAYIAELQQKIKEKQNED